MKNFNKFNKHQIKKIQELLKNFQLLKVFMKQKQKYIYRNILYQNYKLANFNVNQVAFPKLNGEDEKLIF